MLRVLIKTCCQRPKRGSNPRAGVVASLNIANVTEQALKDVRGREKELLQFNR